MPLEKGVGRVRRAWRFPASQPGVSEKLFAQVLTYFAWQKQPPSLTEEVKIAKYGAAGCKNAHPAALPSSRRQFGSNAAGNNHRPQLPSPPSLPNAGGSQTGGHRERRNPRWRQLLPQPPASRRCCPVLTPLPGCKNILEMKSHAARGPLRGAKGSALATGDEATSSAGSKTEARLL